MRQSPHTLSNPDNATLGRILHIPYTITENETQPNIQFSSTTSSGAEAVSSADITVSLSGASSTGISADYTITGTVTGSGNDYTLADL